MPLLTKNRRRGAASKWLKGTLGEEDKHNIGAALQMIIESPPWGPDEKPRTSEDLAAKTARTTIGPNAEDENPKTPINPSDKTAKAGQMDLIVIWSAEFGCVRPA